MYYNKFNRKKNAEVDCKKDFNELLILNNSINNGIESIIKVSFLFIFLILQLSNSLKR
jgi:hypothetical protein